MRNSILNMSTTDLLMKLIQFPSLSTQEKDLVDWLEAEVRTTGLLKVDRYENNLIFTLGSGQNWLFLNSHSDVVPLSESPDAVGFEPYIKDGAIWGRGSTDAKGSGVAMLQSILELATDGWIPNDGRVSFALTICEETSGEHNGMAFLREMMNRGELDLPSAAIIGEPTSLKPCIAQKGLLVLKLQIYGDSGHAARVYGTNAIYEMSRIMTKLESIKFDAVNPFIGSTKITPTRMTSGVANNVMPEIAEVTIDIRTIPEVSTQEIVTLLQDELQCKIIIHSKRFVSTSTDPAEKIVKVAQKVTGELPFGSPTASDWVFLNDIPAIKLGPGNSELSHKPNEHISIEQLIAGVRVYKEIIKSYFSETIL
ncbi:MAG TPA: peptidase M20 [Bacteroidetes bacterium]|nr:peptidase M20 [Bacteroidota bacterium]